MEGWADGEFAGREVHGWSDVWGGGLWEFELSPHRVCGYYGVI